MLYFFAIFPSLFNFFSLFFFGHRLGKYGSAFISCLWLFFSMISSIIVLFFSTYANIICVYDIGSWILTDFVEINWNFIFDQVSTLLVFIVTFISFLVHMYSIAYMWNDYHLIRFLSFLSLFTFSMLFLVSAGNFIQMFFGWEAIGISSFLLINFWSLRTFANLSSMKAMIFNRIGDFFLSLGIFLIFDLTNSFDYFVVFSFFVGEFSDDYYLDNKFLLFFIALFLFLGSIVKSAQLVMHLWLPDAMEGPTPVSALIHAATLVTAGAFLIIRCNIIFNSSSEMLILCVLMGGLTAFFAASVAVFQNDIKKVIAYSTCSQLGYMIFACGLSVYYASLFHLFNHAFFKALLFLAAGAVIHAVSDEQDMRRMGGLLRLMPFTYIAILIGSLSLIGFPFTSGFYSKDYILEIAVTKSIWYSMFVFVLATIASLMTACYSIKVILLTFYHLPRNSLIVMKGVHESSLLMTIPVYVLYFCALFFGYLFKDAFIGLGSNFWVNPSNVDFIHSFIFDSEFLSVYHKIIPVSLSLFVLVIYLFNNSISYYRSIPFYLYGYAWLSIFLFISKRWYFDTLYNLLTIRLMYFYNEVIVFGLDRGFVLFFGNTFFVPWLLSIKNRFIFRLQSGLLYDYLFFHFLSPILILIIFYYLSIIQFYCFSSLEYVVLCIVSANFLLKPVKKLKNEWF